MDEATLPAWASERFDELLESVITELPDRVASVLEEIPVIAMDRPSGEMLLSLGMQENGDDTELLGLHSGTAITDRSVEHSGELPDQIHIFREGLIAAVGGVDRLERDPGASRALREQIRVTLLHEIGHHMGLDEDDLEELGYD